LCIPGSGYKTVVCGKSAPLKKRLFAVQARDGCAFRVRILVLIQGSRLAECISVRPIRQQKTSAGNVCRVAGRQNALQNLSEEKTNQIPKLVLRCLGMSLQAFPTGASSAPRDSIPVICPSRDKSPRAGSNRRYLRVRYGPIDWRVRLGRPTRIAIEVSPCQAPPIFSCDTVLLMQPRWTQAV